MVIYCGYVQNLLDSQPELPFTSRFDTGWSFYSLLQETILYLSFVYLDIFINIVNKIQN